MGKTITGPFNLYYGQNNILADIEKVDFKYTVDTTDVATVQGRKKRFYGTHEVVLTVTFLQSDVQSLKVVLPQYYVANGGVLSTGETVTEPLGAIDVVPGGLGTTSVPTDLMIQNAQTLGEVLRVLACVTEIAGVNIDDKMRTVDVEFTGQSSFATIQMFNKDAITNIS